MAARSISSRTVRLLAALELDLSALRLTHASSAFEEHEDLRLEARHGVELDGELRHRGATSVDGSRKAERSALRECWRKRSVHRQKYIDVWICFETDLVLEKAKRCIDKST